MTLESSVSFTVMGTFEMGASSTGPPASRIFRSQTVRRSRRLRRRIRRIVDHLQGALNFLLRDEK